MLKESCPALYFARNFAFPFKGLVLNFNSMMILFFILRYTITIMRKLGLVTILPLDENIYFHKFTGVLLFIQAWFHAIMHYINVCKLQIITVKKPELVKMSRGECEGRSRQVFNRQHQLHQGHHQRLPPTGRRLLRHQLSQVELHRLDVHHEARVIRGHAGMR